MGLGKSDFQEERNDETLEYTVRKVYAALKETEHLYNAVIITSEVLPDDITFITSQELENLISGLHAKGA